MSSKISLASELCTRCGLCCNGVLFRDVELQPGDDPAQLRQLGLKPAVLKRTGRDGQPVEAIKFKQPCPALAGNCRCHIYADRPSHCRQFECALLQSAQAGEVTLAQALGVIRQARLRVERVRELLSELGGAAEELPLARRFRRIKKRFESGAMEAGSGLERRFGDLTLAMHDLNVLLSGKFFP